MQFPPIKKGANNPGVGPNVVAVGGQVVGGGATDNYIKNIKKNP